MAMRFNSLPLLLIGALFFSGCAAYGADVVYRTPLPDRTSNRSARYIDRDVQAYVQHLDRYLRLDRHQRRRIQAVLLDRTDHLMRKTRSDRRRDVYPFPREYDRYPNRTVRRWWSHADKDIERVLDRRQRDDFRRLVRDSRRGRGNGRYDDRGRGRDRYDDGRYDRRRYDIAPRESTVQQ